MHLLKTINSKQEHRCGWPVCTEALFTPEASPLPLLIFYFVSLSCCSDHRAQPSRSALLPWRQQQEQQGHQSQRVQGHPVGWAVDRHLRQSGRNVTEEGPRRADGGMECERRTVMTHLWRWQMMRWDRATGRRRSHLLSQWDVTTGWIRCVLAWKDSIREMMMMMMWRVHLFFQSVIIVGC